MLSAPQWFGGILALLFLLLLGGLAWLTRFLSRIVEDNLSGGALIHTSKEEPPVPRPELQRESAPLVVFLHETAGSGSGYARYLGFLEELGYRFLAPDLPAPDLSEVTQGLSIFLTGVQLDENRDLLRRAREQAGGSPVIVFGVSRGASLASLLVAAESEEVQPAALILDGFFSTREVLESQIRRFAPIYLGSLHRWLPRWFRRWTGHLALGRLEGRLGLGFPESSPALPEIRCPVLFLHGSRDKTAPGDYLEEYAARLGGESEIVWIRKARHNQGCVRDPEAYRREVLDFLTRRGVGPDSFR